jgi:hypothetical protein
MTAVGPKKERASGKNPSRMPSGFFHQRVGKKPIWNVQLTPTAFLSSFFFSTGIGRPVGYIPLRALPAAFILPAVFRDAPGHGPVHEVKIHQQFFEPMRQGHFLTSGEY